MGKSINRKKKHIFKYINNIIRACIHITYMCVCIQTCMHVYLCAYNYREIVKDIFENAHFQQSESCAYLVDYFFILKYMFSLCLCFALKKKKVEEIRKQKYTPEQLCLKTMNITLTLKFDSTWLRYNGFLKYIEESDYI